MAKWFEFEDAGPSMSGKTKNWRVVSKRARDELGLVSWYSAWRQYVFAPSEDTVFSPDCLRDIADFCEQQTREHKGKP